MTNPFLMADLFITYLIDGDIIGFVIACYTDKMGMAFYGYVLAILSGIFYNRTKSVPFVSVMWLLLGGTFITLTWRFSPIAIILVTFGLVGVIYSLFEKEGA